MLPADHFKKVHFIETSSMSRNITLRTALAGLFALFALAACTLEPDAPVDERQSKDHGDPTRVVLTLRHGDWDGTRFTAIPEAPGQPPAEQTVTYALQPDVGWAPLVGTPSGFRVRRAEGTHHAYELRIRYFDLAGEDITRQFIDNGQDKIHQHFFIPDAVYTPDSLRRRDEERSDRVYDYTYADTTPWYDELTTPGTRLTGDVNPIGFKGVLRFKLERDLRIYVRLMHARVSKYAKRDGTLSPFYAPTPGQLQEDAWDIAMRFPVTVR